MNGLVHLVGEGPLDVVVLQRLADDHGLMVQQARAAGGVPRLDADLRAYARAAGRTSWAWVVLRDLDDHPCPVELLDELAPARPPSFHLRLAVRALESWLLADSQGLSRMLRVPSGAVPVDVEAVPDPKAFMVALAQRSSSKKIRAGVAARPGQRVGPLYRPVMTEFARDSWDWASARARSRSLDGCCSVFARLSGAFE
jgi:hypothetical protein